VKVKVKVVLKQAKKAQRGSRSIAILFFSSDFCLRMGTELVPETLYSNELTRLCARENYIGTPIYVVTVETCRMYVSIAYNFIVVSVVSVETRIMCMHVCYTAVLVPGDPLRS
jgi:hypothetical protein